MTQSALASRPASPGAATDDLVAAAREPGPRQIRAAARLMSLLSDEPHRVAEMFAGSHEWPHPALVLGITGSPGCGKSSLTDHLVQEYRHRFPDRRVGVVAVDPSSPFSGGAVLGDRVRMMRHASDPNVFIRSLASRGHLGGLALGTAGIMRVMGLIGCDFVIIETVGVGQSEVEIAGLADLVAVVLAPGQGDSIQMLKAGLMEAADIFVVNKADRPGAAELHAQLLAALQLTGTPERAARSYGDLSCGGPSLTVSAAKHTSGGGHGLEHMQAPPDEPADLPVLLTSAANHEGIGELLDYLTARAERDADAWLDRRRQREWGEARESVLEEVRRRLTTTLADHDDDRIDRLLKGHITVRELADALVAELATATGRSAV